MAKAKYLLTVEVTYTNTFEVEVDHPGTDPREYGEIDWNSFEEEHVDVHKRVYIEPAILVQGHKPTGERWELSDWDVSDTEYLPD